MYLCKKIYEMVYLLLSTIIVKVVIFNVYFAVEERPKKK
jgi:hypothetical protein